MIARRSAALLATVALVTALAACAPAAAPKPSPTPTGFASKEEAFAAAEKTYRAYIDALNEVDLSDPATFEPVYAHLTGTALDGSKKELTNLRAEALTKSGLTRVKSFENVAANLETSTVALNVCLDVSEVDLTDTDGKSVVPKTRNDSQLLSVEFSSDRPGSEHLLIGESDALGDQPCG